MMTALNSGRNSGFGRLALVAALAASLGACGTKKPAKTDDQRTASGQILPGTISDAMLPYDTATSQPPIAPPTHAAATAAPEADSAQPDAAASPDQPAASPAPAN